MKELKGLFYTNVCLLIVKFLKFIGWNPRTEGSDLRRDFYKFFDDLEIDGERVSYWQVHEKLMNDNFICKKWAVAMDKLYDEFY